MVIFIEGARSDGIPISRALAFIAILFFYACLRSSLFDSLVTILAMAPLRF